MRITSKGQLTIPQAIREALGLLPHAEVAFELDGDSVRLRKARTGRGRGAALVARIRGTPPAALSTETIGSAPAAARSGPVPFGGTIPRLISGSRPVR